jgi:hypothetical protein
MADDPCCASFGGIISITVDGKRIPPTEADISLETSNLEIDEKANQDGSPCYSAKPKLFKADVTFRNACGLVWNDMMRKCSIDVTISEETNNRTHIFTGARFTGTPKINLGNGEVSGIVIAGRQYQALAS